MEEITVDSFFELDDGSTTLNDNAACVALTHVVTIRSFFHKTVVQTFSNGKLLIIIDGKTSLIREKD
jgi:hypothetical protein